MPPLLSKAFQKKTPKYHGTAILLAQDCTMRTAAHLILPSQLQSQTPAGTHWTRNSRVSLSLNPSAPQSHHRFPAHSCLVKLPRVMQPTDTPGAVLLLQPHTVSFHVPSARAALMGTLGSQLTPAEMSGWDGHRRSGDAKMGKKLMLPLPLRVTAVTFFLHFMPFALTTEPKSA